MGSGDLKIDHKKSDFEINHIEEKCIAHLFFSCKNVKLLTVFEKKTQKNWFLEGKNLINISTLTCSTK